MSEIQIFELTKEYRERLQVAIEARDDDFVIQSLEGVQPADISTLLFEYDTEDSKYVFNMLSKEVGSGILIELDEDVRVPFMSSFDPIEIAGYVGLMDSDDGADFLMELPLRKREEIISHIDDEERAMNLLDLLRYDEDVAGGLMAKELIKAHLSWTVSRCIEEIRKQAENVEKIYSVYVVDEKETLVGKVSLKKIVISNPDTHIADIYDEDVISVGTSEDEDTVASIMQKYDLIAIPVINARGRLVGRITIDDIVDVITESAEEDMQLMSGVSSDVEEDDSVWAIAKARLPWLIIGMVGGLVAAQITQIFEAEMQVIMSLAYFIPLIMATGGNVGIQSSSIMVQSLANKNVFSDSIWVRLGKALMVAAVNGSILAIMVFGAVILLFQNQLLAFTTSMALLNIVLLASFMGTITPILLDKKGINPAIASGPFITTANDLLGLAVYFLIARFLYSLG
ncbi:MAG: magnesium transporter [Cyclobacteriaceae bacterium]